MNVSLGTKQLRLLDKSRRYLSRWVEQAKSPVLAATSGRAYLNSWSSATLGWYVLADFLRPLPRRLSDQVFLFLRSVYHFCLGRQYVVCQEMIETSYDHVIVSWSKESDFTRDGDILDRYLNTRVSSVNSCLWIYLSLDGFVPPKLPPHVVVLKSAIDKRFDFALKAALLRKWLRESQFSLRRFFHLFSNEALQSELICRAIGSLPLSWDRLRILFMPYEAQPFQHALSATLRHRAPDLTTVGYLHSAPPPLPTDLIFRAGAPDLLLVHGKSQIGLFRSHLGWPEERLRFIPSLRYRSVPDPEMSGYIFIPYDFQDEKLIAEVFEYFLREQAPATLPRLTVRLHPAKMKEKKQLQLREKLDSVLQRYPDRFDDNSKTSLSVFVGATAAILEALARGCQVVHISSKPIFEAHTHEIWDKIHVEQKGMNLFLYRQDAPGSYIELGPRELRLQSILEQCSTKDRI